ncbi:kelch-like protein 10 isoform X2 [Silurus meridionalis]|uniref:kelch-like protein 10 isoform X2 n=1 Tax=Silurus meridionalis TaxID=175797 RepID=UPI001EEA7CAB|nr:kelch-like protein 10 isoform X2 [Silurus meridionalis]
MTYYSNISEPCDVFIEVEGVQIEAHRAVLSELSPYFSALFSKRIPSKPVYNIPGVAPNIMQSIIQYAYSNTINITELNVKDLLVAADYLLVSDVVQRCCTFLEKRVCLENCREMFQLADMFFLNELRKKSLSIINENSFSNPDDLSTREVAQKASKAIHTE